MEKQRQIIIRLNEDLYQQVKNKCKQQLGIGVSPLIKIMLKAFASQKGIGFYIGDDDLCDLFSRWLLKKGMEKHRQGCAPLGGVKLRDLYNLQENDHRRFNS